MPVELYAFDVHNLTQMFLLFFKLLDSILRFPLKWRERLRYKAAGRAIHPQAARPDIFRRFKILANYLGGQISNAIQVLRGLRRQAEHEIQLHAAPSACKRIAYGAHQIFFGNALVNHVAESLRTCLHRIGQAGFAHLLRLLQRLFQFTVQTQARQRQRNTLLLKFIHQLVRQFGQTAVIARGQ